MTNQDKPAAGSDELWTPGEAAAYLNAGAVNLGFSPRLVTQMVKRRELPAAQTHTGGWRRVPASAIRRLRAEQLAQLGHVDPQYPLPQG